MPGPYTSLTINSETYASDQLRSYSLSMLASFSLKPWEFSIYSFILDWISDKEKLIIKTSGSTGEPKNIEIEKYKMIKSAELTANFFQFKKGDKSLLCLPSDYIAGKMMIVRAFVLGLNLEIVEPDSSPLQGINSEFDFAAMTPMQIYQVFSESDGIAKLNRIKNLIIGGGDIDNQLLEKIKTLSNNIYHTYGMTETLTHIALKKLNGNDKDQYFKAFAGIRFRKDERSCLVIKAPHLSNEDIITNDIVNLISDKEFEFKGRFDHIINSGGIKLFPEEIERKLKPYIEQPFYIFGLPDEKLGETVTMVIEGIESDNIMNLLAKAPLTKFEKPKKIFFREKLQRTGNGKIKRDTDIIIP